MSEEEVTSKILDNFTESTTIAVIGFISQERSLKRRLLWFCILIILTILSGYQAVICVQTYYQYSVTVTTQLSSLTEFPAVTFCNLNPIMISKLSQLGDKQEHQSVNNESNVASRILYECVIECVDKDTTTVTKESSSPTYELIFLNSSWTSVGASCYLNIDTPISYDNATDLCKLYGSTLPVFHSQMDWVEFKNWANSTIRNRTGTWIGLNTGGIPDISTYRYVDGTPFTNYSSFWIKGEPNGNKGSAQVAVLFRRSGLIDDIQKSVNLTKQPVTAVCYRPSNVLPTCNKAAFTPIWTAVGNSCYWNTNLTGTFDFGNQLCQAYGSYLPIFRTQNDWIDFKLWGSQFSNEIWIGLVTNGTTNSSTFKYVNNLPFIDFLNFWNTGEPNGEGLTRNGLATVTRYNPNLQYIGDIESNWNYTVLCYKPADLTSNCDGSRKFPTWTEVSNSCYWQTNIIGTFEDGIELCSAFSSHLPIFTNDNEWKAFKTWGKQLPNEVWIGLITNGGKDASKFKYVDNSPFVSLSEFWFSWAPGGLGSNSVPANATVYMPASQLCDDSQGELILPIICYKQDTLGNCLEPLTSTSLAESTSTLDSTPTSEVKSNIPLDQKLMTEIQQLANAIGGPETISYKTILNSYLYAPYANPMSVVSQVADDLLFYTSQLSESVASKLGYDLSDMLKYCAYNGTPCLDGEFNKTYYNNFGNCFTFNSIPSLKTLTAAGQRYGLILKLSMGMAEYLASSVSGGIRMIIHDQKQIVFPDSTGFNVNPGSEVAISLTTYSSTKMSEPYGNCVKINFQPDYSVEGCSRRCQQQVVIKLCNCGDPALPKLENALFCTILKKSCILKARNSKNFIASTENCTCPPTCNEKIFIHTMTKSVLRKSGSLAKSGTNNSSNLNDLVSVKIYFQRLDSVLLAEVTAYEGVDLFSDLGNWFGLLLGFSVITLFEIIPLFYFLFEAYIT